MFQSILTLAAALLITASPAAAAPQPAENAVQVQAKLDSFAVSYLASCNVQIRPGKAAPQLTNRDGKIVATYMELDPASVKTELYPGNSKEFAYVAKLTYLEHTYEAIGNTPEEAINGVYMRIKSRRLIELPRYVQGAWKN